MPSLQDISSIAFEITTSNKESKPNMERAEPIWRRLFRIMFGFVVNLIGVWSKLAPFFNDLSAGYETEDLL